MPSLLLCRVSLSHVKWKLTFPLSSTVECIMPSFKMIVSYHCLIIEFTSARNISKKLPFMALYSKRTMNIQWQFLKINCYYYSTSSTIADAGLNISTMTRLWTSFLILAVFAESIAGSWMWSCLLQWNSPSRSLTPALHGLHFGLTLHCQYVTLARLILTL